MDLNLFLMSLDAIRMVKRKIKIIYKMIKKNKSVNLRRLKKLMRNKKSLFMKKLQIK